jgi:hypothetical protein
MLRDGSAVYGAADDEEAQAVMDGLLAEADAKQSAPGG